ncbi:MAG: hypothetical protein ACXVA9_06135 [Bdellovibrionales bacterium]
MIYFSVVVFSFCGWFLPWYGLGAAAFILGIAFPDKPAQVSLGAALAWAAGAYLLDGQSHGIISQRMSGLFGLPSSFLIFLVMAFLAAVTAFLCFNAGAAIRGALNSERAVV